MRYLLPILVGVVLAVALWLLLGWSEKGLPEDPPPVAKAPPASSSTTATSTTTTTTSTTVAPTTTTTARARTAPIHSASVSRPAPAGDIPAAIRAGFARFGPAVAEQAVRVSSCETGGTFDPTVVNASGHTGLFQISRRYHEARVNRLGFTWDQMREAWPNITVAADLYAEQGWRPWTCRYAA